MNRSFKSDLLWNYASLCILAVSGLVMNFLVAHFFGSEALGIFNQVYAVYIVASQIAVGGIHFSVLRSVAQNQEDTVNRSQIIVAGIFVSFFWGCFISLTVFLSREFLGGVLKSAPVVEGLFFVSPAIVLFSLNKVVLGAINGMQRMRIFAILQSTRYIILVVVLVYAGMNSWSSSGLALSFLFAELGVTIFSLPAIVGLVRTFKFLDFSRWIKHHIGFGIKGFLSGVLIDLNTRIDVLMLGYFLDDRSVGIYSLAAIVAEGVYQALIVVRNNMNPWLAKYFRENRLEEMVSLIRKSWKLIYFGVFILVAVTLLVFYLVVAKWLNLEGPGVSLACLAVLCLGIFLSCGFIPYEGILLQGGRPGWYTGMMFLVVITNILLNIFFIPYGGVVGAAIATSVSVILSVVYLNIILKINFRISFFSTL